ncbi:hypothetical protein Q4543_23920 [Salipiger sp. 1_MG-2023]|uniref:hypothetical protein n=1 Tax=Salipiger sp. 1_MG-2023 TaxID=3062665 RepID=UPI0026E13291|nr:hypothetical protein [Salipiger sp. 1_MG-2023]MDO6588522.1 hypothetical protein [Salipiger sp. 1_MG-2023]
MAISGFVQQSPLRANAPWHATAIRGARAPYRLAPPHWPGFVPPLGRICLRRILKLIRREAFDHGDGAGAQRGQERWLAAKTGGQPQGQQRLLGVDERCGHVGTGLFARTFASVAGDLVEQLDGGRAAPDLGRGNDITVYQQVLETTEPGKAGQGDDGFPPTSPARRRI